MYCHQCGAVVPAGQQFCGKCGKELPMSFTPMYVAPSRVQQHVRLLGILWIAFSAFNVIGAGVLFILANTIFARSRFYGPDMTTHGPGFLHPLMLLLSAYILLKAAAGFIAGFGLLHHESWARLLTIVLSFLALFNVPFGTALGIYGLWILLPASAEREYEQVSRKAA